MPPTTTRLGASTPGSVDGFHIPERGRNNFSYAASKAAVHALTQHLAGELAPRMLVDAIAPVLLPSRMTNGHVTNGHV
ncbi:SDR family NAD(P)-dependent oxidoreductase [Mycobacterium sp. C31M]